MYRPTAANTVYKSHLSATNDSKSFAQTIESAYVTKYIAQTLKMHLKAYFSRRNYTESNHVIRHENSRKRVAAPRFGLRAHLAASK